jgi:hypothetical protein
MGLGTRLPLTIAGIVALMIALAGCKESNYQTCRSNHCSPVSTTVSMMRTTGLQAR